jgi:hypothetical protein
VLKEIKNGKSKEKKKLSKSRKRRKHKPVWMFTDQECPHWVYRKQQKCSNSFTVLVRLTTVQPVCFHEWHLYAQCYSTIVQQRYNGNSSFTWFPAMNTLKCCQFSEWKRNASTFMCKDIQKGCFIAWLHFLELTDNCDILGCLKGHTGEEKLWLQVAISKNRCRMQFLKTLTTVPDPRLNRCVSVSSLLLTFWRRIRFTHTTFTCIRNCMGQTTVIERYATSDCWSSACWWWFFC